MMKASAVLLLVSASALLSVSAFLAAVPAIGYGAIGLGLLASVAVIGAVHARLSDVILIGYAVLCSLAAVFGMPVLVEVTTMALAVAGWDATRTSRRIVRVEPGEARRFTIRYLARAFIVPGSAIALAATASRLHIDLTFGSALGLAVGCLLIAALLVRLLRGGHAADT